VTAPNPDHPDRFYGYAGYPEQAPVPPPPPPPPPLTPPAETAPRGRSRASRPSRRGRRWIIALVILLGLLIAADRVGVMVAESVMASQIQKDQKLSQKPGVSISGFPFLTQVVSRNFGHVTADIHGLNASGVPISDIHADLVGVHVNSGFNSATVDSLTATAMLSYADLSNAVTQQAGLGTVTVSQGGPGQLKATYSLAGVSVSGDVAVTLLAGNQIELKYAGADTSLLNQVIGTPGGFDVKIPLGNLPFGIQLKTLSFTANDVDIVATGQHVALSQTTTATTTG
jgi:DUF2993 family protein